MARPHADWLKAYIEFASYSEAPTHMHFWAGVSAVAGALRRKVWIDQKFFRWYANQYIVLVAPPGIVSKSTTTNIAMSMLREVPGIRFGPDVVTWPALVQAFAASAESFEWDNAFHPMCAMTLEASEFGNLVRPDDPEMIDLLISLWDGKQGTFQKVTKTSGTDEVVNPWINLIACTTPSWIAGNFPEHMIGGGFTSRCLFVYTERKSKLVAYPSLVVPEGHAERRAALVDGLVHIAENLAGPYTLTPDALAWGTAWYERHYTSGHGALDDSRFGGYLARKQTHIHKLAMVLAAATRDELVIHGDDLALADRMISDLEEDMPKVFAHIGRTPSSQHAERLIAYVRKHRILPFDTLYRAFHSHFPNPKDFEAAIAGGVRSGQLRMVSADGKIFLAAVGEPPAANSPTQLQATPA